MSVYRIDFDAMDWECPAEGVRFKVARSGDTQVRLVEFTPALSHPEWCRVGHAGYVLEGTLEVTFYEEVIRYEAGDGLILPPGEAHKHIPRAITDTVRLLLVEKSQI